MQTQHEIRQHIQSLRQALSPKQQQDYSKEICDQIIASQILDKAKHIVIYLPVRGEADPTSLMQHPSLLEAQFYLPVLSETKENHLAFANYDANTIMKQNRFKIPEPDVSKDELIDDPTMIDYVITPLVGVDNTGNRIGMGGGFYDRTFAFKKTTQQKPLLIGFCYDFQLIASQTPQDWDVPVDAIATQSNFALL